MILFLSNSNKFQKGKIFFDEADVLSRDIVQIFFTYKSMSKN